MLIMREVTEWDGIEGYAKVPNHLYWMNGDNAVAYQPFGTGKKVTFNKPLRLDLRHRKFEKVGDSLDLKLPTVKEVKGSKGDTYYVDTETGTCSCPGFKFRGACKHV